MSSSLGEIVFAAEDVAAIQRELLGDNVERCAILYAHEVRRVDGLIRLLVREIEYPGNEQYTRRGPIEAELSPACVAHASKKARRDKMALVFVHSHPGSHRPKFSPIDDDGESKLRDFLTRRNPNYMHASLVISEGGFCAREIGTDNYWRVLAIGMNREILFDPSKKSSKASDLYDRQVRAFGRTGQSVIETLRIAIVGLGGTGSIVAQQLAHLGVRDFILVDPDSIETSNLNRIVNAFPSSVAKAKVDVAADYIASISNSAKIKRIQGDITRTRVSAEILNADFIFGCTDSHGSRAVMQQIAYQFLIPCIDMGSVITATDGSVKKIFGRVQLLAPGLGCFTCSELLNPAEVRRDMMTEFERKEDPYIQGAHEPAPAVISINGTVASLALSIFLAFTTGIPIAGRHLLYDAMSSKLRSVHTQSQPTCYTCSKAGALGRGHSWPLLGRQD